MTKIRLDVFVELAPSDDISDNAVSGPRSVNGEEALIDRVYGGPYEPLLTVVLAFGYDDDLVQVNKGAFADLWNFEARRSRSCEGALDA